MSFCQFCFIGSGCHPFSFECLLQINVISWHQFAVNDLLCTSALNFRKSSFLSKHRFAAITLSPVNIESGCTSPIAYLSFRYSLISCGWWGSINLPTLVPMAQAQGQEVSLLPFPKHVVLCFKSSRQGIGQLLSLRSKFYLHKFA